MTQPITAQFQVLTTLEEKSFKNNIDEGESTGNQYLLLFSQSLIPYLFTTQSRLLMTLKQRAFENIVGRGENGGN